MRDQSVISMFDNSGSKVFYPAPTSLYGKNVEAIEKWDSVTSPPYKVLGTVIRASNTVHEIEEKVISAMKESDTVYKSLNSDKDKFYVRGTVEESEKSDSLSSSKRGEIDNGFLHDQINKNDKTLSEDSMNKCNLSVCHFLNPNSTAAVALNSTISASSTVNDIFKKIQDEFDCEKVMSNLRIIDIVEIFNTLTAFVGTILSYEISSATHHSSLSDNSTFKSVKDELFDETDMQSVKHFTGKMLSRTFSQIHHSEGEEEVSRITRKEGRLSDEHSGNNIDIDDYAVVKDERGDEDFKKNSKLSPQISGSEFTKNDINGQEKRQINDCDISRLDTSKEDSEQRMSSNFATPNETKLWKKQDEMDEKFNQKNEKDGKSPILVYFERSLWEKLVAGLKCSQRDCNEALRPTESVRRYLIEPSISRARKHSNG